jgi:hypothetical protein
MVGKADEGDLARAGQMPAHRGLEALPQHVHDIARRLVVRRWSMPPTPRRERIVPHLGTNATSVMGALEG